MTGTQKRPLVMELTVRWQWGHRGWCLPNRWGRCLGLGPIKIWFKRWREPARLDAASVAKGDGR